MNDLQTAIATVRANLGLSNTPSDWTYEERIAYNKALANYIANNPAGFSEQTQATASLVIAEHPSPLSDESISSDLSTFGGAVAEELANAGNQVAGVGNGVLNTLSLAKWLIPLAAVIAVGILLYGFYKKQTQ